MQNVAVQSPVQSSSNEFNQVQTQLKLRFFPNGNTLPSPSLINKSRTAFQSELPFSLVD
jgi:hypothetical protein